jgi:hypothetical protein
MAWANRHVTSPRGWILFGTTPRKPEAREPEFRRQSRLGHIFTESAGGQLSSAFVSVAGVKLVAFDRALRSRGSEVFIL